MSSGIGANGMKEVDMKLSSFGSIQVVVTAHSDNPELMSVDVGAERRREVMSMMTNKDETVDQFCQRLRGMLRALWNAEPSSLDKKEPEQKAARKEGKHV